ncbi:putative Ubiquinol-cytochrome c chaperone [Toxoplasma gondii GAB2-2007-GAL-DOM2]|uniref:Putative Ubiquinol-cytochrome c chaperone n=3 Tax=Toxoplasma gondii TaxID=5811 RepID=V4YNN3_TOXGV|nr:putative Ubiquinol-cytochrome c chaperone [Toxoplasma gondii VEG]KFG30133.1 putative Ubiquinol-cytochrome c chaperone [Toxoplasma gondii p89]KFG42031.1 putative Ubiquinol-cytochrome c chaperone [Toxoplasma gondii GAB2-2007-GAL-DOM2]CEL72086.1 TPA: Ubiquinol-cytochrome c chaperone, putative [Toxoplasma gondii VEG]
MAFSLAQKAQKSVPAACTSVRSRFACPHPLCHRTTPSLNAKRGIPCSPVLDATPPRNPHTHACLSSSSDVSPLPYSSYSFPVFRPTLRRHLPNQLSSPSRRCIRIFSEKNVGSPSSLRVCSGRLLPTASHAASLLSLRSFSSDVSSATTQSERRRTESGTQHETKDLAAAKVAWATPVKDKGLSLIGGKKKQEVDRQALAASLVAQGAEPFVALSAADEVAAAGSLGAAINERLIDLYKNSDAGAAERKKTYHPFVRPVEGVERQLLALESERLLSDSLLLAISPARSAKYCVPLPNEHRAAFPLFYYNFFGKHRQYTSTAWKFVHLILERTEADYLHAAFNIPGGFNGRFYFFMLHLWILHKRLCLGVNPCMQAEKQRKQFLAHRRRLWESRQNDMPMSALENSEQARGFVLDSTRPTARSQRACATNSEKSDTSCTPKNERSDDVMDETKSPARETDEATGKPGGQTQQSTDSVCAWDQRREEEEYLLRGNPLLVDVEKVVEGEMIDAELFKLTWDIIRDWILQKHVPEARFEFELRNCQQYAFGFFAGLDEALTDDEIYAARIKEILWGNVYSGQVSFDDAHLNWLTKYLIRQLTHVMHIHKAYFYKASFTWADFPMSADFPAPRIVPPLAQRVHYGGYTPSVAGPAPSRRSLGGRPLPEQLSPGTRKTSLSLLWDRLKSKLWLGRQMGTQAKN